MPGVGEVGIMGPMGPMGHMGHMGHMGPAAIRAREGEAERGAAADDYVFGDGDIAGGADGEVRLRGLQVGGPEG